jgi:hypothetical protein
MRFTLKLIGFLLTVSGLGGAVFTLIGLADPRQAQLANDNDPFGVPPTTEQFLVHLAVCAAILGIGLWLMLIRSNRSRSH